MKSIYQYKKSALIRSIRVIRVPLASIRLCVVAALLLLSFTVSATGSLRPFWEESPEIQYEDLHIIPRYSFGEEQDLTPLDVESLTETIDKIYDQEENILRAGGNEGGGDSTNMIPVGSVPVLIMMVLAGGYVVKLRNKN